MIPADVPFAAGRSPCCFAAASYVGGATSSSSSASSSCFSDITTPGVAWKLIEEVLMSTGGGIVFNDFKLKLDYLRIIS